MTRTTNVNQGWSASSFLLAINAALLSFGTFHLLRSPQPVYAQTSDAVCSSNFSWTTNSRGQTPCLVAAYLIGACNDGVWNVPSLPTGRHYIGPRVDQANECQCSTVVYDLMSACVLCQDEDPVTWSRWSFNCTNFQQPGGVYRPDIPIGTSVPAWAYLDPTVPDSFDATQAQQIALQSKPDSSAPPGATNTNTGTASGASPTNTGTSPNSGGSSSNVSSGPNIGAIVGGVVGGVFAIGLIAILIVWLVRRSKQPSGPAYQPANTGMGYNGGYPAPSPAPPTFAAGSPAPGPFTTGSPAPQSFYAGTPAPPPGQGMYSATPVPASPFVGQPPTMAQVQGYHPNGSSTGFGQPPRGQYTGAAEI